MNASEREPVRVSKVRFTLMGFDQKAASLRQYTFQGDVDGVRTAFTVGVDLAVMLKVGIHIQELPLLCREILEQRAEGEEKHTLTLTEDELRVHAETCLIARAASNHGGTPASEAARQRHNPSSKGKT